MKRHSIAIFVLACLTLPVSAGFFGPDYHIDEQNEQLSTDIPGATVSPKSVMPNGTESWVITLAANWSANPGPDFIPEPEAAGLVNGAIGVVPKVFQQPFTIDVTSENPSSGPPGQALFVFEPNGLPHRVLLSDTVPDSAATSSLLIMSLVGLFVVSRSRFSAAR
jgi:hypothetical protein